MDDAVLTLREAAEALHMTVETVRRLVTAGTLRGFKSGTAGRTSGWRVRASAISRFIAERESQAAGAAREG